MCGAFGWLSARRDHLGHGLPDAGESGLQLGQLVLVQGNQSGLHVLDPVRLSAGLVVVAEPSQRCGRKALTLTQSSLQPNGVAAGHDVIPLRLMERQHARQVRTRLGVEICHTGVGGLGTYPVLLGNLHLAQQRPGRDGVRSGRDEITRNGHGRLGIASSQVYARFLRS